MFLFVFMWATYTVSLPSLTIKTDQQTPDLTKAVCEINI